MQRRLEGWHLRNYRRARWFGLPGKNAPGMPVFVNIGNAYPNGNRAQVVIWGERVPEFEEMLNAVDDGTHG